MKTLFGTIFAALLAALSAHGAFDVRDFGGLAAEVVSDTNRFTCGSGSVACLSPDATRIFAPYLASTTGFGECHDIAALADIPIDRPSNAVSHVICKIGDTVCGTKVKSVLSYGSFLWKGNVRVYLDVNQERFVFRDWNPQTRRIAGEGVFSGRWGGMSKAEPLSPQLFSRYLGEKGFAGFNPCREHGDRCIFQSKPQWRGDAFYGFLTSSCSQPILFLCRDGATFEFVGAVPAICEYECQLAIHKGLFYAVMRGAKGDNFWTSSDGGVTWKACGRVPDGLQRQQMMVWRNKVLIGYSAPDEKPSKVRNGRNNLHLLWGEGADLSAYREIYHARDPIGIVYPDLVNVNGTLHLLWSNSARFPTHVKWGAVQGKDQILHAKLEL